MKRLTLLICIVISSTFVSAQQWDIGGYVGVANYFGDLNTNTSFSQVRPSFGFTARNHYNLYFAIRPFLNVGQIAGSDIGSRNPFEAARKLDFETNFAEFGAQLELNFKKYAPGKDRNRFAPYGLLGMSILVFNPKGSLEEFPPQSLEFFNTEGQSHARYPDRRKYSLAQVTVPFGMGIKYKINYWWNFAFEVAYRKTFTDYLDDVSRTYIDPEEFDSDFAATLADKSRIGSGEPIGFEGKQRGESQYTDSYVIIGVFLTYTIRNKRCPF